MKWEPRSYQDQSVRWILENPGCGLFQDPGAGKTSSVLRAFVSLQKVDVVDRMLVLAPLSVCSVWEEEAAKWDFSQHLRIVVLHGAKKHELLDEPADVQVMNYEGLRWLHTQRRYVWPEMLVADESTKLKHGNTARFGYLRGRLASFDRRVILTGTPSPNGLMDLWGQLYVVDGGERLHPFITRFRNEFFTQVGPYHDWVPHPDAEERIRERIADVCLHIDLKDHLDLPPLMESRVPVVLPAKALAVYKQLEEIFFTALDKGEVTVQNAGVLAGKLRQVAGGAVYVDGQEREWDEVHDAKITALLDRIETADESTFVLYEYDHERERLEEALEDAGYAFETLHGTRARRKKIVDMWNRESLDVLLGHPGAAGHGLNLQAGGRRVLWFGPTWNLEHHIQAIGRLYRQGQKQSVFVDTLVAKGTIDELILRMQQGKAKTQRDLLEGLKAWRKKR